MGFAARVARTKQDPWRSQGWEERIRPAPLDSSGGHRVRAGCGGVTVDGLRGLLILLSLPERAGSEGEVGMAG